MSLQYHARHAPLQFPLPRARHVQLIQAVHIRHCESGWPIHANALRYLKINRQNSSGSSPPFFLYLPCHTVLEYWLLAGLIPLEYVHRLHSPHRQKHHCRTLESQGRVELQFSLRSEHRHSRHDLG